MAQKNCIDCGCEIDRTGKWQPGRRCHSCYQVKIDKKRKQLKKMCVEYHGNKCSSCGGVFPIAVYDFHHTDNDRNNRKDKTIGHMTHDCRKWETITEELDRCVMLCANCHRIEHYGDTML